MLKHLILLFVVAAYAFQPILAAVVTRTVYYIGSIETPTPSTIVPTPVHTVQGTTRYSAIGTAEGGKTKYDMEVVLSYWVQEVNGTPQTFISAPWTRTYTVEENASHLAMSAAPSPYTTGFVQNGGVQQECDFDPSNLKGKCVEVDEIPIEPTTASDGNVRDRIITFTTTYTAAFTPVATFTAESTSAGRSLKLKGSGILHVALLAGSVMTSWFVLL